MGNPGETAVFVKDAEGVLVFANDAFARLLRRANASELLGKRSTDSFPAEVGAMLRQEDEEVLAKGEVHAVKRKLACRDGKSHLFVFRKTPVSLGERKYLFCTAEMSDETDVRARFFSAISHDVRTPLNAIVGYAQILQNSQDAAQRSEAAKAIDAGTRNLLSAIDGVMTILSPSSAAREPTVETCNINEATLQVVKSCTEAAAANKVELRLSSGVLPLVEFAVAAYKDILARLLENAVRHTPSGYIEVRTAFDTETLTLQVKDQSRGMSPGEIAEVMDPNAAPDPNRCPGSSTLCLVVAKRLAEKLNGSLSISSGANSGTTVSVVFRGVRATDGKKRAEFARTQKMRTMRIEDPFRFEKRILVVDDVAVNVRILSLLLSALGFKNVVTATSGEKALELVRSQRFNVVLSDLMMPGMDGRELLRQIRRTPGLDRLPVYAVTADDTAPVTCANDGFAAILLKPITKDVLKEIL